MDKKLSQLSEKVTSLNADDLLYVSSNGVSRSIKASTVEAPLKAYADQKKSEVITEIEAVESSLNNEISARIAADASNLSSANSYADQKKSEVVVLLNSESSSRSAGDASTLTSAKAYTDTKHSELMTEVDSLESSLTQESSNRIAGDASTLSSSYSYANQKKSEVVDLLNAETSSRISGDSSTLSSANSYADQKKSEVVASLNSEISRATATESALGVRIDNILSNVTPGALDSLSEVVTAFQNADSNLNSAITALATELAQDIQAEESARISADSSLQNNITLEESARIAGDATLQSQIDSLTTNDVTEGSNLYYTDERVQNKLANLTGHIVPDTDEAYDLGSPTKKFRELHLAGNTIYLGGFTLSSSTDEGFVVTDPNNESAIVTDGIKEGISNLFFTEQRVQETDLSMLDVSKTGDVSSSDKLIDGISKLQNSITTEVSARTSADNTLDSKINTEISNRVSGDSNTLASANSYTDTAVNSVRMPVGAMHIFAGTVAPTGYLICDGSAVSRTTYSALFAVVGTSYGSGNGSSTFNLPNPDTNANLRYIIKI